MAKRPPAVSAGLLMFRRSAGGVEVFLVHPGGPFWKNKDSEVVATNGRGRPTKYRADYSARAEI